MSFMKPYCGVSIVAGMSLLCLTVFPGCDLLPGSLARYEYYNSRDRCDILYTTSVPDSADTDFAVRGYGFYGTELGAGDVTASLQRDTWIPDAELILEDSFSNHWGEYRGITTTFGQTGYLVVFARGESFHDLYYCAMPIVSRETGEDTHTEYIVTRNYIVDSAGYTVTMWKLFPSDISTSLLPE